MINKKFLLAGRPVGRPISDDDFEYQEEEVRDIQEGEVLLENLVIEFQPAQKGWMEIYPTMLHQSKLVMV